MKDTDAYILNIDTPTQKKQASRKIELRGWLILKKKFKNPMLRILQGDNATDIKFGIWRQDVSTAFKNLDKELTEYSGFEEEFECLTDEVYLQLDTGNGFETIHAFQFEIISPYRQYNPLLSTNWMDHKNLMETKAYYNHAPLTYTKSNSQSENRAIAFYLPQFHPIPENDLAWGKGFTEWVNIGSAEPRFVGHNQPLLPGDLGYYDLRIEENIKAQIDLARNHDLYGFCVYYYWFSGKKVLDMPLNTIIEHKEWDFNFMICWANENWTKRWDGRDKDVIFEQKYREEDPLEFIKEVEHILLDPRYIRVNGKPILAVYRCEHLDDANRYAKVWRDYFRERHQLELELVSVMSFSGEDPKVYGFDAGLDFSPSKILRSNDDKLKVTISVKNKLIDPFYDGTVFDYRSAVKKLTKAQQSAASRIYDCVVPSWDNDARKKGHGSYVLYNESPTLYKRWLEHSFRQTTKETPFVFINAWNEWAEGTVLEPTRLYGYAILNKTKEAINNLPIKNAFNAKRVALLYVDTKAYLADIKKAVEVLRRAEFNICVTVTSDDFIYIDELKKLDSNIDVLVVPERGGDILPFIEMIKKIDYTKTEVVVKLAFVENRESPLSLVKNERTLLRHIRKAKEGRLPIFSGVAPGRSMTKQSGKLYQLHRQMLSFVAPSSLVCDFLKLDLLPEDFNVKSKKEFKNGMIEDIPTKFLELLGIGYFVGATTKQYKKYDPLEPLDKAALL